MVAWIRYLPGARRYARCPGKQEHICGWCNYNSAGQSKNLFFISANTQSFHLVPILPKERCYPGLCFRIGLWTLPLHLPPHGTESRVIGMEIEGPLTVPSSMPC